MTESISTGTITGTLKKADIFSQLPPAVIENIAAKIVTKSYAGNELIIRKGDKGNSMFLILSGEVKVHDGDVTVAEIGEGNFFGEFSLLDDEPRSMSVSAKTGSVLGSITQEDFYKVLNNHPGITRDIIRTLIKRLRGQNSKIISQMKQREEELEGMVNERTLDLKQKNDELAQTLEQLRQTQEQLVMKEKLANLGQLTAGIAHEIKNPLNFVNNFSALSVDLLKELAETSSEEERKELIEMIADNLSKINAHGKRADSIVSGMMMHARESKSQKAPVNINQLLDEALNFAYNGYKSGTKNIEVKVEKNYEKPLPETEVIIQDMNRVFINLITNSLYALTKRKEKEKNLFDPVLTLATSHKNGKLRITVRDNGTGIPEEIKAKIFNPFFTTKPTGEGTGLGLSLSFDIVKAHGGEINVESKENEFTEFEVALPVN